MLESFRKGQRWLTLAIIIFVGAVFVFFMGVGGGFGPGAPTGNAVIELGAFRMGVSDFQRLRAQQEASFRERLGENFDPKIAASFLDSQTLSGMVSSVILADSARELGMRVSREEVQALVRQSPSFRDEEGKFDRDAFVSYATWEYGSQRTFLEMMRQDLLRQKMVGLLYNHARVSESEARDAALYGLEEVRIAYVAIDKATLPDDEKPDEAVVQKWLEEHREALQADYDARLTEFQTPERVRARHILIALDDPRDAEAEAAAREAAEAARARLLAGEDFASVAQELSDDPGSKEIGGDLGLFSRGTHTPEIEEAAFGLEPGDISDPIQSAAGFHIVRLDAREPATTRSFEEVGPELARAAVEADAAGARAQQLADALSSSIANGQTLEDAAREKGLTLERTGMLRRRPDGFIPGLGGAPDAMNTVFSLSPEAPSSSRVFDIGGRLVLVQLIERSMPDEETLESTVRDQTDQLLAAKRNRLIQDWIERRREQLEADGRLLVNSSLVISGS